MTVKNQQKEIKRKTQIAQAAFEIIGSKGLSNTTIDDIAHHAGLSKGGILHYFKTKEDILIYLLEMIYETIRENIRKRVLKYSLATKKLKAIIITFIKIAKLNPLLYTVLMEYWAQTSMSDRIKDINEKIYSLLSDKVRTTLEQGIESGEFIDVDPVRASYVIVPSIMGIAVQYTLDHELYNVDHLTKTVINMVMAYLSKKE